MNLTDMEKKGSMTTKSYIVGLPESGKTTFLGALTYTVINSMPGTSIFEMYKVEDIAYLSGLSNTWSKCEKMDRTNIGQYESCTLFLKDAEGNKIELKLPDQSGEEFKNVIQHRTMSEVMYNDIFECDNIFLFINPNVISKDVMINEIEPKFREEVQEKAASQEKNIHEQVQYVMLLQDINSVRKKITKLKVIISAWDIYKNTCPKELLKEKLPLVWQYLVSNNEKFDCEFWGISAQGGDLTISEVKERLLDYENAIERIIVVDENNEWNSHDLTALLK